MEQPIHAPTAAELPSKKQLNRATLIAAGVAAALLVTTILPAEYGVDPTGVGSALGLTPMGKVKREQATSDAVARKVDAADDGDLTLNAEPAARASTAAAPGTNKGEVTLTLAPDEGTEVKASMKAGDELDYRWSTGGPKVNFEFHGEETGAASRDYTSYEKGTSTGGNGKFRAPFDGTHGWYWRNRTSRPLTIKVEATGAFQKFERI